MRSLFALILGLTATRAFAQNCSLHLTGEAAAITDGMNHATPPLANVITLASGFSPGNILFAPVNVLQALQALYPGNGPIQATLTRVLGLKGMSRDQVLAGVQSVNNALNDAKGVTKLKTSVSVWANKNQGYGFPAAYVRELKEVFGAASESLDFTKPESLDQVNGFVATKTDQMIPKLLDRLDPSLKALLITTLFVEGSWLNPFERFNTKRSTFTVASGEQIEVDMMNQIERMEYGETPDFQVARLDTQDGRATMEIYLPRRAGLDEEFAGAQTARPTFNSEQVRLSLPRFKLSWSGSIMKALDALVMLGGQPVIDNLTVSEVLHVTELEVSEEGFRGAAATAMFLESFSVAPAAPVEMKVDRSFGLRILVNDGPKSLELFRGWVDRPDALPRND